MITACDWGRTPSKERFEKNSHIIIPAKAKILRDEYQDMGSDYVIYYTIKLPQSALDAFVISIKRSDYYNDTVSRQRATDYTMFKGKNGDKAVWRKSSQGYKFYKRIGEINFTEYNIDLDTASGIGSFKEAAN